MRKSQDVKIIPFNPTRADAQKGRWVLDDLDVPKVDNVVPARGAFVCIGPNGWAANHRHQRQELLLGLSGDPYLIWRDSKGMCHEEQMVSSEGTLRLYFIPSGTPHLVENRSPHSPAVLHEWSDVMDEAEILVGKDSLRPDKS